MWKGARGGDSYLSSWGHKSLEWKLKPRGLCPSLSCRLILPPSGASTNCRTQALEV